MSGDGNFDERKPQPMPTEPTGAAMPALAAREETTNEPPLVIGELYEVIGQLGQGGMGSVLKARNQRLPGKFYAIKILNPILMITDPTVRQRFEIEAQATAKLSHPNLVTVFDYGFTAMGAPYLVMEYLDGQSIDRLLKLETRPSIDELLPVFAQVCKALHYIHSQNVVHRDLKPHNIMVQSIAGERYAKLIDLGIAKVFSDDGSTAQHLTATGMAFGSPHYMSPEQCKGDKVDQRADIYSLGCVIYECMSGHPPFQGENPLQTLYKQVSEAAPPLPCVNALESEVALIIERCIQKEPSARYQDAAELLLALNRVNEDSRRLLEMQPCSVLPLNIESNAAQNPQLVETPRPQSAGVEIASNSNLTGSTSGAQSTNTAQVLPDTLRIETNTSPLSKLASVIAIVLSLVIVGWLGMRGVRMIMHPASPLRTEMPEVQPTRAENRLEENDKLRTTSRAATPDGSPLEHFSPGEVRAPYVLPPPAAEEPKKVASPDATEAEVRLLKEEEDRRYKLMNEQLQRAQMQANPQVTPDAARRWKDLRATKELNNQLGKANDRFASDRPLKRFFRWREQNHQ